MIAYQREKCAHAARAAWGRARTHCLSIEVLVRRRFWRPKRHKSADPPRAGMPRVVAHRLCAGRCERGPAPRQEGNLKLSCGRRPQGRPAGLAAASGPARVLLGAPMGPLPCVKAACVASGRTSRGGWHLR